MTSVGSEVFTPDEIARAADVPQAAIDALIRRGALRTVPGTGGRVFIEGSDAVRAVAALLHGVPLTRPELLFTRHPRDEHRRRSTPFAASGAAHVALVVILFVAAVGSTRGPEATTRAVPENRLVYVALTGPGGGGGGGGARSQMPPAPARRHGRRAVSSPVPARPAPPPEHARTEPQAAEVEIAAPVAAAEADEAEQAGVIESPAVDSGAAGPGADGVAGTGAAGGVGDGNGGGIDEGDGGGMGGGPYRPGSGVEPPRLLHEVKPAYSEAARVNGIQGDVLLELVVRRDGSIGEVKLIRGLGYGLDELAVDAVRRWRFAAGRLHGVPVEVMVEVAMDFRLR